MLDWRDNQNFLDRTNNQKKVLLTCPHVIKTQSPGWEQATMGLSNKIYDCYLGSKLECLFYISTFDLV